MWILSNELESIKFLEMIDKISLRDLSLKFMSKVTVLIEIDAANFWENCWIFFKILFFLFFALPGDEMKINSIIAKLSVW